MTRSADLLVLGAGPAGAAAAITLARAGRSVAIVARERADRPRIGETVPAVVVRPLAALGVWDAFRAAGHGPAPGTVSCWGSDRIHEWDAIRDPHGPGWHLDRDRFDAQLLAAARAAGADLVPHAGPARRDADGWTAGGVRAPFLVDARGRAGRLGGPRRRVDRLVALVRFGRAVDPDPRTVVEACREGWWYAATLPGGRAVTAFFTDADLLPTSAAARDHLRATALAGTRLIRQDPAASRTWIVPAHIGAPDSCVGPDWVAVGDAARTLDPLSGHGLTAALASAIGGARAALAPCRAAALRAYRDRIAHQHRAHIAAARAHYQREQRFSDSPFWRRRSTAEHTRSA